MVVGACIPLTHVIEEPLLICKRTVTCKADVSSRSNMGQRWRPTLLPRDSPVDSETSDMARRYSRANGATGCLVQRFGWDLRMPQRASKSRNARQRLIRVEELPNPNPGVRGATMAVRCASSQICSYNHCNKGLPTAVLQRLRR